MSIFVALLVLSFLIFFHELGHFTAARLFGVRVEVFSIGFGKRILTKKLGDTEFSLALIPLGGYVKMKGQDDLDPTKHNPDSDSYNHKKPWQRITILFAGPLANFILAYIIFYFVAVMGMPTLGTKVYNTLDNSPAYHAGLIKGDIIKEINGIKVESNRNLGEQISVSEGVIELIIDRNGTLIKRNLEPKILQSKNIFGETVDKKMIGISLDGSLFVTIDYTLLTSFGEAWYLTVDSSKKIAQGLQKLIQGVVPMKDLGGVVGIVDVTAKAVDRSWVLVLFITALISVNLGILNLLPIPALDGGHIMFNTYEIITKRPPSDRAMLYITIAGWAFLLSLMIIGTYNDINRLLQP